MGLYPVFLSLVSATGLAGATWWEKLVTVFLPELWRIVKLLLGGLSGTGMIFALTLLFSIPLGILVMFCRRSRFAPLRVLTTFYISVMRGTPLMLQLVVFYYAPYYFFKIMMNKMPENWLFLALIVGFSINYAAYFAEIFRSGLSSIAVGQYEAANVLDFGRMRTFLHIILPQMVKNVLPSVTNEMITLVKDTSLAFTLSYVEMFTLARQESALMVSPMPLFVAGIFYYVANLVVAFVMARVEKKFDYYHV
ncbi:MAG: amino acid ABC transporter permease [Oscillospiraceae bacterium]|jgi:His/Glu/Gln/Arg/opine family amino acid ABC transporter permease subunit|nr:amino acid ABC transporter permease [Oscillospiraceae bacterium]